MDSLKVYVNNELTYVDNGTTLLELSKKYQSNFKYDIILAKVNSVYSELNHIIKNEEKIEFFDLHEKEANRVYLNGLIFLLDYTYKKVFNGNLKVNHSLDKGLLILSDIEINEDMLLKLELEMNKLIDEDIKIEKLTITRTNAFNYYKSVNKMEKYYNIKYNTNTYLTMYKIKDYYDYFYSMMPYSTLYLKYFKFNIIDSHSFVLTFPTIYMEDSIKSYEHREHIFNLFKETKEWSKNLGLEYVCDLNKVIESGKIRDLIMIDEMDKNDRILSVAKDICSNNKKVVLIAGPSSTGKTTTTNKLCLAIRSCGKIPKMISMDDFFKDRTETPIGEDGSPDYECLEAVDISLFDKCISSLIKNEEVILPVFNFLTGKKEYTNKMILDDNDILLIEGIHAMNPNILTNINKENKVKIYLSPLSELNVDRDVRIPTTDNRLLRRIVRDNRTRGYNVNDTLEAWSKVRLGEEKYIFPYQDMADYTINTALIYEICALKVYVEPLLYSVDVSSPYYGEVKRLLNFLRLFLPIPSDDIPIDSIIREFIGGGCFKI